MVAAMVLVLSVLLALGQLELLGMAFQALGLSRAATYALLSGSIVGSLFNVPLCRISRSARDDPSAQWPDWDARWPGGVFADTTVVMLNVGGCVVPVAFALYLLVSFSLPLQDAAIATGLVSLVSYAFSRVETGIGVTMPAFVSPLAAALVALVLNPSAPAALAYVGGTLGVLIGADVLRLRQAVQSECASVSIGGAGPLDGVFVTGILAVLLTWV